MVEGEKIDNGAHKDANRSKSSARAGQVDTHLSLLWLFGGRMMGVGGGLHWMRAAVGVSVRWGFLLPPSLLQPRGSPMGCIGIKYLSSMRQKTRGAPLQLARVDRSGAAQKCRKTESVLESVSAASGAIGIISLPVAISKKKEKRKSPSVLFWEGGWRRSVINPLCTVFRLSRRRSEEHLPNLCTLTHQGGK